MKNIAQTGTDRHYAMMMLRFEQDSRGTATFMAACFAAASGFDLYMWSKTDATSFLIFGVLAGIVTGVCLILRVRHGRNITHWAASLRRIEAADRMERDARIHSLATPPLSYRREQK